MAKVAARFRGLLIFAAVLPVRSLLYPDPEQGTPKGHQRGAKSRQRVLPQAPEEHLFGHRRHMTVQYPIVAAKFGFRGARGLLRRLNLRSIYRIGIIISIINDYFYKNSAKERPCQIPLPIPLPTTSASTKIPLPADLANCAQTTGRQRIF
jgi:hypothetical protein